MQVKLLSHTEFPLETIYVLWKVSRDNAPYELPSAVAERTELRDEVRELFVKVLAAHIPVSENVSFTFLLEDVPISFREQMVRHRIGVKVGERVGIDMVPDLAESTWWSQSMRILDMGSFATEKHYHYPESAKEDVEGQKIFTWLMDQSQRAYKMLVERGWPMEQAREVIPLAATHRISWTLNLSALQHIVGKRGCWILQGDLWEPIIRGMVEELEKVDPIFRTLIAPPCVKGGCFKGCLFELDNERRAKGEDKLPPCPLWHNDPSIFGIQHDAMLARYSKLWGFDPFKLVRK